MFGSKGAGQVILKIMLMDITNGDY